MVVKSEIVIIQMNSIEQYFHAVLLIVFLHNTVFMFFSGDETRLSELEIESYSRELKAP